MRKFNIKPIKGVWVPLPDDKEVSVNIKPTSVFVLKKLPSDDAKITIEDGWNMFNAMLIDWKGIVAEDDKPIKCNEENKRMIFEYDQDLVSFVMEECNKLRESVIGEKKQIKNLSSSQPGEDQKKEK